MWCLHHCDMLLVLGYCLGVKQSKSRQTCGMNMCHGYVKRCQNSTYQVPKIDISFMLQDFSVKLLMHIYHSQLGKMLRALYIL